MDPNVVLAILYIVFAGMFGAVIGSFTNVCIYRIPEHRTIVKGHSMCMTCSHELGALDLVPIFSWLFLGGKCRYCKTPISSRYIKIESLTALAYMVMAATHLSMFLDPSDPAKTIFPFIELCAMFIMINIVIVEMMIMKDTGSSMYVLSLALGIDILVQIAAGIPQGKIKDWLISVPASLAIGIVAVLLAVIITNSPKDMSRYFKDDKQKTYRTSDLFAVVLCAAIGIIPSIVAALVYLIARIAIGNGKKTKYLGIALAAGAAAGYFGYAAYTVLV
ncbi:MAG: prepilin peptidase [Clostridiales bacterium]|nr:prepilin peptidase [Clostridiales bacterium]